MKNEAGQDAASINARNRKIGLFLIITPFAGLIAIMILFAIANFVLTKLAEIAS